MRETTGSPLSRDGEMIRTLTVSVSSPLPYNKSTVFSLACRPIAFGTQDQTQGLCMKNCLFQAVSLPIMSSRQGCPVFLTPCKRRGPGQVGRSSLGKDALPTLHREPCPASPSAQGTEMAHNSHSSRRRLPCPASMEKTAESAFTPPGPRDETVHDLESQLICFAGQPNPGMNLATPG